MAKILIVDDHEILRKGICQLLTSHKGWTICGEAACGIEAIDATAKLHPDVLVLDISMPGINGIETATRIRELGLKTHIIIFTMHGSEGMVVAARLAGAEGYVCKAQAGRDLVTAVESVLKGGTFFPADKPAPARN